MGSELGALQDATFARASPVTASSYPPERRLDAGALERYLDERLFAVVSSTRPDGRPHAAPTSYVRRGRTFWLPTATDTVRERNVRAQPWLVLCVTQGDRGAHVAIIVEGPGTLVAPVDTPPDVVGFAGEWATVWIRLEAARVRSYAAEGALADAGD
jgi:hypothetical protein